MKCIYDMRDVDRDFFFQGLGFEASVGVLLLWRERELEREREGDQAMDLLEAQFVFPSALALSPHTGNIMNSSLFECIFFSLRPFCCLVLFQFQHL